MILYLTTDTPTAIIYSSMHSYWYSYSIPLLILVCIWQKGKTKTTMKRICSYLHPLIFSQWCGCTTIKKPPGRKSKIFFMSFTISHKPNSPANTHFPTGTFTSFAALGWTDKAHPHNMVETGNKLKQKLQLRGHNRLSGGHLLLLSIAVRRRTLFTTTPPPPTIPMDHC